MNKMQNYSAILAGIAITAILVASSLIAGNQFTQQAHAQATTTTPPSTTTAPRPTTPTPTSGTQQPPRPGQTVNWQGTVSSIPSPLAGHTRENVAIVLPLRNDGGLYTGVITFTASKSARVQVWNTLTGVAPGQPIGEDFGSIAISPSPNGRGFIATSDVSTGGGGRQGNSGSVPFAGNALALVADDPFIATYSVTAQATAGRVVNNLTSAATVAAVPAGTLGGESANATSLSIGSSRGGSRGD
jgi:hypothetical protein